MKISEMIKELAYTMSVNGDQELVIMTDGKRYPIIEVYTDDEYELYLEGYEGKEYTFAVTGLFNTVAKNEEEATNLFTEADFGELKDVTIKGFEFFVNTCTMKIAGYFSVMETDAICANKRFNEADFGELFYVDGVLV